jgi:hypothetical protein
MGEFAIPSLLGSDKLMWEVKQVGLGQDSQFQLSFDRIFSVSGLS